MTKVHGKRYAYKFDFQGLAASLQPQPDHNPYSYRPDMHYGYGYPTLPPPPQTHHSHHINQRGAGFASHHPAAFSSATVVPYSNWSGPNSYTHPGLNQHNQSLPPTSFYN